jgi:tRNA threonylcarbamoyladenosine biosynthesis protein TsaB
MSAEPRFLILETSGRQGQVALARGSSILQVRRLDEARRHARDLAPAVADILAAEEWKPREVQAVIVNRGPGSYTGLRVGIMSAKIFAYATGCRLIAIDSFAAVACQAPSQALSLCVIADAQQDKIYEQRFSRTGPKSAWIAHSPLMIQGFSEWAASWVHWGWISGPGLRQYVDRLPAGAKVVPEKDREPHPQSLLQIGLARWSAGERDDPWKLEPLYLRPSSAEEKRPQQAKHE